MISPIGRSTSTKVSPVATTTAELPYRSMSQRGPHSRNTSGNYPSPPERNSPAHRQEAFAEYNDTKTAPNGSTGQPPIPSDDTPVTRRRRGSSLTERYPGDKSHHPLATLSREKARADKASHITRKHHIRPDTIDALDNLGPDGRAYHHSGPYDATLYARNNSSAKSPLEALAHSNAEALKATPQDKIRDSIRGHRPLDGVATYAPGMTDRNGQTYDYVEGENMMIGSGPGDRPEGGAYKRWPGLEYNPDDVKGKSEPSYTIEKSLKDMEKQQRQNGNTEYKDGSIEMSHHTNKNGLRPRSSGGPDLAEATATENMNRSGSVSKRWSGGMKKRIGSIKRQFGTGES